MAKATPRRHGAVSGTGLALGTLAVLVSRYEPCIADGRRRKEASLTGGCGNDPSDACPVDAQGIHGGRAATVATVFCSDTLAATCVGRTRRVAAKVYGTTRRGVASSAFLIGPVGKIQADEQAG